jgi:hypothetical protein
MSFAQPEEVPIAVTDRDQELRVAIEAKRMQRTQLHYNSSAVSRELCARCPFILLKSPRITAPGDLNKHGCHMQSDQMERWCDSSCPNAVSEKQVQKSLDEIYQEEMKEMMTRLHEVPVVVSVIVPVYRQYDTLLRALDSVTSQVSWACGSEFCLWRLLCRILGVKRLRISLVASLDPQDTEMRSGFHI